MLSGLQSLGNGPLEQKISLLLCERLGGRAVVCSLKLSSEPSEAGAVEARLIFWHWASLS
ncbi:MAG TPA: hypothetical protein VGU24_06815 [Microvirga sp.]|jgi:hypothetical protein|nr:hypothetical protein [Microvirga sp.]